ncbi:ATP-binding protein [Azospirillum picis]|uniref:Signal transduction histidine kinase n=1 Tax=Azospirillum picis TaxID=488438 RepID=A0ABU0MMQ6_9PROT|nr:ATP-binding protein [Azospirillum picis]MBP2300555.1 signal transduction histidine kinase [Azospirillum picis]MDQ0534524.1 signal transduction histidine kinase [Azospirillum picis]
MAKFWVRARAVDMLGRQQIAGIPTALHELFKNAHDAYARRVEVDYFRADRQLILRDDGDGMSRLDFEQKWLTLGTDSKVNANRIDEASLTVGPRGLKIRKILGEKGIGRLAVAAIGPLVLVLTRCDPKASQLDEITVALVHWGLFEIPGIDLGEIDIPIVSLPGGTLPGRGVIESLVAKVAVSINKLVPTQYQRALTDALQAMSEVDPVSMADWLAAAATRDGRSDLSLRRNGHGTHFVIVPVDPILNADIDVTGYAGSSPFQRLLLGFGNTLAEDNVEFSAEFRDHREDGVVEELIGKKSFFSLEEFESVDHHFEGRFDEFGNFTGTIQLYRGEKQHYALSWPQSGGRETDCGPFRLRLGYLMGLADESRLPRDEHGVMFAKLQRFGGLYIYRDGIRVLPYGNSDYDFLNIEQRRTLKATDWFFSYRRMLGWIDITHGENSALVEKAGREGFRENKAYRQFRDILENFFKQLAIDYFRPTSDLGEDFRLERQRRVEDADRLKQREASSRERKKKFAIILGRQLDAIERGEPADKVNRLKLEFDERLSFLDSIEPDIAATRLLDIEAEFLGKLQALESGMALVRPRGIALARSMEAAWKAYDQAMINIRATLFEPVRIHLVQTAANFRTARGFGVERQKQARATLEREKAESLSEVRRLRREAEQAMMRVEQAVREVMRDEVNKFQRYTEEILIDLGRMNLDRLDDIEAYSRQRDLEQAIANRLNQGRVLLEGMRDQLTGVASAIVERNDLEETAAALERRAIELQDRLDLYTDLAQAGSAIGIVGHEFSNVADGLRNSVRRLKPWSDGTPALKVIYDDLVSYFDELDNYLGLFAPLSRRRYRKKASVKGAFIEKYLLEALASRMHESHINLEVTDSFRTKSLEGFLSTILGASLNIVDNALYWATLSNDDDRRIILDADEVGWLFSNNGPGIPLRMAERIFDFGVSTKPGGRGMGLAISRDALQKIGCDLELLNPGAQNHPIFRIAPNANMTEENVK